MSIKDWASYASVDTSTGTVPTWVWSQEYPWDVIQYRYQPADEGVSLPGFVQARMFDATDNANNQAYPPSQLSLFGLDITMTATWLLELPSDLDSQVLVVGHDFQYATGSHYFDTKNSNTPTAKLTPVTGFSLPSASIDLTLLGLDPVRGGGSDNGAVVGFLAPNKFVVAPSDGSPFKIISDANTLQVTGQGFDSPMASSFSQGQPTQLTVQFKVIDEVVEYCLFMKHWKTAATGLTVTIVVNGDPSTTVVRRVDDLEGDGADNNLTVVSFRNLDYTSANYHDYLSLGLNTVEIAITPDSSSAAAGYVLRTVAIGQE